MQLELKITTRACTIPWWGVEATKDVHERGLARTGRTHDGEELTARHRERDAAQRGREAGCGLVDAVDVLDLDDGGGHGYCATAVEEVVTSPSAEPLE